MKKGKHEPGMDCPVAPDPCRPGPSDRSFHLVAEQAMKMTSERSTGK
jgi:hypothetical protein